MSKVKSVFKVLIILMLVAAAIGGAIYLFYANFVTPPNSNNDLQNLVYSSNKANFSSKLTTVQTLAQSAGNNNLRLLVDTTSNLDDILNVLSGYIILQGENNSEISKSISIVNGSLSASNRKLDEYILKSSGANFNLGKSANTVYESVSAYIVNLSNTLMLLNSEISKFNLNKDADIKFSMIDLYLRVCTSSFKQDNLILNNGFITLKSTDNITLINGDFELKNGFLVVSGGNFSAKNNQFISYYNICDKQVLAAGLKEIVTSVTAEITDSLTAEQKAAVCFKNVYGI